MKKFISRPREPFSGLSHWLGVALAVIGFVALIVMSWGKPVHLVAFAIYGVTLVLLYAASAIYHSSNASEDVVAKWQKFDYVAIYLLIAGTYVPVCLLALHGAVGWGLLVAQTILATSGVLATLLMKKVPSVVRVLLYLVMGWMAVAAMGQMQSSWPPYAVAWLVAGGIVYSVGAVVYALDRPHLWPGKFSAHDLWHIFVLGGSACHFILMVTYVVRIA